MWDCEGWELWGWETWQDKISSAGGADGAGAWHITARHRIDMHCDTWGAHGDNCGAPCSTAVRKKPHFTHVRANLRGDVSGKRFSTHAMERNVVRIGEIPCRDDKGMESAEGE